MKKYRLFMSAALLAVLLLMNGIALGAKMYAVTTGPVGGPMYAISGAWADVLNSKQKDINLTNQVGGGSVYTMRVLANKEAEFAMVGNDVALFAYQGIETFKDTPVKHVRAIAALYPESFHVVVKAGSPYKTVEDLKGKKVAVGPPASGTQLASTRVLEALGLTFADFKSLELGFNKSAEYLRDGNADAAFYQTGLPYGPVVDISVTKPVELIGLSKETIAKIISKYPFYVETLIPKTTYKGMTQDVRSVSVKMLLLVDSSVSDADVYLMTKMLFENLDRIKASHAMGATLNINNALEGITVPLHPGAEKFYREQGVLK